MIITAYIFELNVHWTISLTTELVISCMSFYTINIIRNMRYRPQDHIKLALQCLDTFLKHSQLAEWAEA